MPHMTPEDGLADLGYACSWSIPVPLIVLEGNTIVFVNAATTDLLGYDDPWELIGSDVEGILHPDTRAASVGRRAVVALGERLSNVPSKLLTRAGEGVAARISATPLEVDGASLVLVQLPDMRRPWPLKGWPPAPALGAISGPLGRAVLEAIDVPVIAHTTASLLFANAVARRQLGAESIEEIANRPMLSIIHPDAVFSTIERGIFFMAKRQPIFNVPIKLRGLRGTTMRGSADAYPVACGGKLVALVVGLGDAEPVGA